MSAAWELANTHRVAQLRGALAVQELAAAAVRVLDPRNPATRDRYEERMLPALAVGFGASAALSASWYELARRLAGVTGPAPQLPPPVFDEAAAAASLRITGPVVMYRALRDGAELDAARDAAARSASMYAMRATMSGGRQQLIMATDADPSGVGWKRIVDPDPCDFCAMLAGRGAVYRSDTVRFRAHDGCGCGVQPVFEQELSERQRRIARRLNAQGAPQVLPNDG